MIEAIHVRELMKIKPEDHWTIRRDPVDVIFEDQEIVNMTWVEIAVSSLFWEFASEFKVLITSRFSLNAHMKNGIYTSDTHSKFFSFVLFYLIDEIPNRNVDYLCHKVVEIRDRLYNYSVMHTGTDVMSMDIIDIIGILLNPVIAHVNKGIVNTRDSIDNAIRVVSNALENEPGLQNNSLVRMMKSKIIKKNQLMQCITARGYLTDMNSFEFPTGIVRGYAMGIRTIVSSLQESRSAAKSAMFAQRDLQNTEYSSRKLQLLDQNVARLHHCDCGSKHYLQFTVKPDNLPTLLGKYYVVEEESTEENHVIKPIRDTDTHLIGKTIRLRSTIKCQHEDPSGVCAVCFGELGWAVFPETNLGHMCTVTLTEKVSQSVLSVKHLDGSTSVQLIVVPEQYKKYLRSSRDGVSYYLSPQLKGKVYLQLSGRATANSRQITNINDIFTVNDIGQINPRRITEFRSIAMKVETTVGKSGTVITETVEIPIGYGHRPGSFSLALLSYFRDYYKISGQLPYTIDSDDIYVFDITGFPASDQLFILPLRNHNMADYSKEISSIIESSQAELEKRDKYVSPEALLLELYELVNSKLTVNLSVLEGIMYGAMIRSAENYDYRLPKPHTDRGLGVMSKLIAYRSFSAALSYQNHLDNLRDPVNFLIDDRMDHPMDSIFMPKEVADNIGFK